MDVKHREQKSKTGSEQIKDELKIKKKNKMVIQVVIM